MSALVVDTHTAIWYLLDVSSLSPDALTSLDEAARVGVYWFKVNWNFHSSR